jgi:hypothetical protein
MSPGGHRRQVPERRSERCVTAAYRCGSGSGVADRSRYRQPVRYTRIALRSYVRHYSPMAPDHRALTYPSGTASTCIMDLSRNHLAQIRDVRRRLTKQTRSAGWRCTTRYWSMGCGRRRGSRRTCGSGGCRGDEPEAQRTRIESQGTWHCRVTEMLVRHPREGTFSRPIAVSVVGGRCSYREVDFATAF